MDQLAGVTYCLRPSVLLPAFFRFVPKYNLHSKSRFRHLIIPVLEYLNILVVVWAFVLSFAFYVMYLSNLSTGPFDRGVHLFTVVDYRTGEMINPGYTLAIMKKREDGIHTWGFNPKLPKLRDWRKEWDTKEVRATAATVNFRTRMIDEF